MNRRLCLFVAAMFTLSALIVAAAEHPAASTNVGGPPTSPPGAAFQSRHQSALQSKGGFTGNGTQPPLAFSMVDSGICQACHGFDFDPDNEVEPWDTWAGTMMAQATRDPIFWAALDVANNDALQDDDIPDDIGQFCLRCHTPVGWLEGRAIPDPDGCGLAGAIDTTGGDFDGVTCHTCHRMMVNGNPPDGQEPFYLENGQYWIDDEACAGGKEPCRRGPYDYPADGTTLPNHPWAFSAYHESSDICGNCHNVTNPVKTLIDGNGLDTGIPFPVERTYDEWALSEFAPSGKSFETCQGCHMPDATADPVYACQQSSSSMTNNHSGDLPIHQLAGGNTWIPDVIEGEYPNLGFGFEDAFDRTKALALDMLQNRSATVEISVDPEVPQGEALNAQVKITNTSGHKLPTGYSEGRRMWIHVEARDGQGGLIWESGAYEPTDGLLTEDAQAKVYRVEQGIWNRNGTGECDIVDELGRQIFHFVLSDCIRIDNRIPPLGFTGVDDPETRPVGYVYPETFPGSGILVNYDTTDYAIPLPLGTEGPVTVSAALRYQTASKEYIDFLRDQAVDNMFPDDCTPRLGDPVLMSRGEYMYDVWTRYDRSPPVEMGLAAGQSAVTTPLHLDLTGVFDSAETFEACETVALGPGLVLEPTADLTVVAGIGVELHSTVDVQAGARLAIEIDPAICD